MKYFASLVALALGLTQAQAFDLTVVHLNDFHARVQGTAFSGSECKLGDPLCEGGWPRIMTAAKQMVQEAQAAGNKVLFIDNGDMFMGTLWSSFYKGKEAYDFLNLLCDPTDGAGFDWCVGAFGNHEWDYGQDVLLQYIRNISYPMVSTNIVDGCTGTPFETETQKSVILEVDGTPTIGIVGYVTTETPEISSAPACLTFQDEVTAIQNEIQSALGSVDIIIATGHSGYTVDKQVAQQVPELDLIVGGHSHTFLWKAGESEGPALSSPGFDDVSEVRDSPEGDYPTMEGNTAIVQVQTKGRYLGRIDMEFDNGGVLTSSEANIVLVGSNGTGTLAATEYQFEEDAATKELLTQLNVALEGFGAQVVGQVAQDLSDAKTLIRQREAPIANMICNAVLEGANDLAISQGNEVKLCLQNGGGIRAPIEAGDVTVREVLNVLPFGNVMTILEITGEQVYEMCETAARKWKAGAEQLSGSWGHYGPGFQVYFDVAQPSFQRVVNITLDGTLIENNTSTNYRLVTNDFLANGGDGYSVLKDATVIFETGPALNDVVSEYITDNSPVDPQLEERIVLLNEPVEEEEEEEEEDKSTLYLGVAGGVIVAAVAFILCGLKSGPYDEESPKTAVEAKVANTY